MRYTVNTFTRIDNSGVTDEYQNEHLETLAYFDHYPTGAAVTVFDPYKASRRTYSLRATDRAETILSNHLKKLGYTERIL